MNSNLITLQNSPLLQKARMQGIYASIVMFIVVIIQIIFIRFSNILPFEIILEQNYILRTVNLIGSTVSVACLWLAFNKIAALSQNNVFKRYKNSLIVVFIILLALAYAIDHITQTMPLINFFALFFGCFICFAAIWIKISYKMAQITQNRLFSIYSSSCLGFTALLLAAGIFAIIKQETLLFSMFFTSQPVSTVVTAFFGALMLLSWINVRCVIKGE
ncbi:MAG: hypothetical protein LUC34_06500 [Campylobacter sp.]|nr:hypothetical protein [Campylobacter sp.]